jgi:hypothetical protein
VRAALDLKGGHREALVRARIGQASFRQMLLDRYGEQCAFTGPTPLAALEAAHLYRYADLGRHDDHGGLLLRRDLHRLFDLGYIAVDSRSTISVDRQLRPYPLYAELHGKPLKVATSARQRAWLAEHWHMYVKPQPPTDSRSENSAPLSLERSGRRVAARRAPNKTRTLAEVASHNLPPRG